MKVSSRLLLAANVAGLLFWGYAFSRPKPNDVVVRIAQLEIDSARLEEYTHAVREEMEDAVRIEPGVLAIYAMAEKGNPRDCTSSRSTPARRPTPPTARRRTSGNISPSLNP